MRAMLVGLLLGSSGIAAQGTSTTNNALSTIAVSAAESTQACNNYVEFCNRQYSNITEVCAHDSPFYAAGNIASDQIYDVVTQLNDGVRMLEGQTHMNNGTLHFCHTFCALQDAGPIEAYFKNVSDWLDAHPNEVVTILIANGDSSPVTAFVDPIQSSGLGRYVYTPPTVPMTLGLWPTLGELILDNHRVIIFMDYGASQTTVSYILDQYSQLWETPFSPIDASFPCTINRPPGLSDQDAKDRLYLTNHNLNVNLNQSVPGLDALVPDFANINRTNGVTGFGSLGLASDNCAAIWGRPPNFLVVDYYNYGSPSAGSVFEVVAKANGVSYTRSCCGPSSAASSSTASSPTTSSPTAASGTTSSQSSAATTVTTATMGNAAPQSTFDRLLWTSSLVFVLLIVGI